MRYKIAELAERTGGWYSAARSPENPLGGLHPDIPLVNNVTSLSYSYLLVLGRIVFFSGPGNEQSCGSSSRDQHSILVHEEPLSGKGALTCGKRNY